MDQGATVIAPEVSGCCLAIPMEEQARHKLEGEGHHNLVVALLEVA